MMRIPSILKPGQSIFTMSFVIAKLKAEKSMALIIPDKQIEEVILEPTAKKLAFILFD